MNDFTLAACEITIRLLKAAPPCAAVGYALAYLATDYDPHFWTCMGCLVCGLVVWGIFGLARDGE